MGSRDDKINNFINYNNNLNKNFFHLFKKILNIKYKITNSNII